MSLFLKNLRQVYLIFSIEELSVLGMCMAQMKKRNMKVLCERLSQLLKKMKNNRMVELIMKGILWKQYKLRRTNYNKTLNIKPSLQKYWSKTTQVSRQENIPNSNNKSTLLKASGRQYSTTQWETPSKTQSPHNNPKNKHKSQYC